MDLKRKRPASVGIGSSTASMTRDEYESVRMQSGYSRFGPKALSTDREVVKGR